MLQPRAFLSTVGEAPPNHLLLSSHRLTTCLHLLVPDSRFGVRRLRDLAPLARADGVDELSLDLPALRVKELAPRLTANGALFDRPLGHHLCEQWWWWWWWC
eukprot:4744061-Prymnesium_polylepis.1